MDYRDVELQLRALLAQTSDTVMGARIRGRLEHFADVLVCGDVGVNRDLVAPVDDWTNSENGTLASVIVQRSSACFCLAPSGVATLSLVAKCVHGATLLHADVADEPRDLQERATGTFCGPKNNAVCVLAGDLLLSLALTRVNTVASICLRDLLVTFRRLLDGETTRRSCAEISEGTYFRVVNQRSAALLGWCAQSGARASGASGVVCDALRCFGERVGLACQLFCDAQVFERGGADGYCALRQNGTVETMSLPLIRALAHRPCLSKELGLLRGGDLEADGRIRRCVCASGVCESVRADALDEIKRAMSELGVLCDSESRRALLEVASRLAQRIGLAGDITDGVFCSGE